MNEIDKLLSYDALGEAEKCTGKSYKEDEGTVALGMFGMMVNHQRREQLLTEAGDTTFSMDTDPYFTLVLEEGFHCLRTIPFKDPHDGGDETMFIMWHPDDGLLLVWDTYHGKRNRADIYFNWTGRERGLWPIRASGCWTGDFDNKAAPLTWVGHFDAREALLHHLTWFRANGVFLKQWMKRPFLWLLHYGDTHSKEYDHEAINAERIASLPAGVQQSLLAEEA